MDPALTFQNGLIVGQDGCEPSQEEAREGPEVEIRTLGIDLAKNVFRVYGVDARSKTTVQRLLRRRQGYRSWRNCRPAWVGNGGLRRSALLSARDVGVSGSLDLEKLVQLHDDTARGSRRGSCGRRRLSVWLWLLSSLS
jgi:hypothetical protein